MDREAIAREQRRRQASDALEFERERAAGLEEQLGILIAELEGPRVDEEAFAQMAPEDVELARSVIAPGEEAVDEADEDAWLIFGDEGPESEEEPDPREQTEDEIARLQEELEDSRRRRQALERYIDALGAPG